MRRGCNMITASQLEEYAAMHGLFIHPDRDLEHFVGLVNTGGGKCPCDGSRLCPCPQAPEDAKKALREGRPKEAACTCHLMVTKEYLDAWGMKVPAPSAQEPQEEEVTEEPGDEDWQVQTEEIQDLVLTIKAASNFVEKGKVDKAAEVLMREIDKSECDMCQKLLMAEASRMGFIQNICEVDEEECKRERAHAVERAKRIEKLLKQVDKYAVTHDLEEAQDVGEVEERGPPERKIDSYHACLSAVHSNAPNTGALPEYEKQVRFAISSKLCAAQNRGEQTSFEEELEKYKDQHPEMFTRMV